MNADGLTLAASNWLKDLTFINRNFNYRPYFIDAMKGKHGRYFALGSTSGKRGYYFAYPVNYAAENLGVIVIKMDLSNIEMNWSNRKNQFIVSDLDGVTFITTKPSWLYHSIKPLSSETLNKIKLSQRYNGVDIHQLNIKVSTELSPISNIIKISNNQDIKPIEYFTLQKNIPEADWSIMIMTPLNEVRKNKLHTIIGLSLICILTLLISFLFWLRVIRQHERAHIQQEVQKQLKHQVTVRTTDLTHEIDERKRTEKRLRDTQDELIQTAKFAVLGQMSASISHELNNPLAAIHSYSENARKFLGMQKFKQVDENLSRIDLLTQRMSKISSQLKFFSRKSNQQMEIISLQKVIESAIEIISHQYKNNDSIIEIKNQNFDLKVRADIIQLEQILINLINNAMQALESFNNGKVIIDIEQDNQWALVHIDDNGHGIELKNMEKIFDPFFTTKVTGLGLGLSISARIMDIMNGKMSACNLPEGGARFTISLLVAES